MGWQSRNQAFLKYTAMVRLRCHLCSKNQHNTVRCLIQHDQSTQMLTGLMRATGKKAGRSPFSINLLLTVSSVNLLVIKTQ